jgi:hypothetical protein
MISSTTITILLTLGLGTRIYVNIILNLPKLVLSQGSLGSLGYTNGILDGNHHLVVVVVGLLTIIGKGLATPLGVKGKP